MKRIFLIVLDSFGMGALPDADLYGDAGSDTLGAVASSREFYAPALGALGLFNIEGVNPKFSKLASPSPAASFARMAEQSAGKDTTIGHFEIAGLISKEPFPTFPGGFPSGFMKEYETRTGRKTLCNKPYSGTEVINDFGKESVDKGALIVYTSADSVFQVAAHEDVVGLDELYRCCRIAREMLTGSLRVARVIARPFKGSYPNYERTSNRHDFSVAPDRPTLLDIMSGAGYDTIGVGKIYDIFAGQGITEKIFTKGNSDGMDVTIDIAKRDFNGLCFVNLVDFDMVYGHRNDTGGYARAISEFDKKLTSLLGLTLERDTLIITADHGCDPSTASTDHSREYVPMLICGPDIKRGQNLGTRNSFADIAATILEFLGLTGKTDGQSFASLVKR